MIKIFNYTSIGYDHIRRGVICQDHSDSYVDEEAEVINDEATEDVNDEVTDDIRDDTVKESPVVESEDPDPRISEESEVQAGNETNVVITVEEISEDK